MPRTIMRFVLAALGIGGSLALTMCGGGETGNNTTGTSCPNGICGPATGTGGGTTMMTGTGGMMAGSGGMTAGSGGMTAGSGGMTAGSGGGTTTSSGSMTTTSSSSTSSGSTCTEAWICGPWDTGGNGNTATRTCTDKNNCMTTNNKPPTTATLPALDQNYFKCNVEPILDRKCSMLGCHGTETGRELRIYSRARLRDAAASFSLPQACTGTQPGSACIGSNSCPCNASHTATEWQRNYDAARSFALDSNASPLPDKSQSDLLQQPVVGGKSHAGIHLFKMADTEYSTILNWLNGATLASCNTGLN